MGMPPRTPASHFGRSSNFHGGGIIGAAMELRGSDPMRKDRVARIEKRIIDKFAVNSAFFKSGRLEYWEMRT